MKIGTFLSAIALALAVPALAQDDPRIVENAYSPDRVYPLAISAGHASVVQLEQGEAVESIVVGQADGWLVEPTASADRVVVKPLPGAQRTNMTILTTKRSYAFTLNANSGLDVFIMRFSYASDGVEDMSRAAATYRFRGDRDLYPRLMSDNGRTTTVYWPTNTPFPAVFVRDADGEEIAADYRPAGDGLVIDGVHEEIVFRSGDIRVRAIRREQR